MPKEPKGEKRPADVVGAAIMTAKIATGEIEEKLPERSAAAELGSRGGKARAAWPFEAAPDGNRPKGGGEAVGQNMGSVRAAHHPTASSENLTSGRMRYNPAVQSPEGLHGKFGKLLRCKKKDSETASFILGTSLAVGLSAAL
jgi:hypothetical protein